MPRPITLEDQITFRRSTEKITFYEYCKRNGIELPKKPEPEPIKVTFQKPAPRKIKLPDKSPEKLLKEEFSPPIKEIEPPTVTMQEIITEKKRLKKAARLKERARKIYDHLLTDTLTASQMAKLLGIPKDYTYKHIKEIRTVFGYDRVVNVDGVYKLVKE